MSGVPKTKPVIVTKPFEQITYCLREAVRNAGGIGARVSVKCEGNVVYQLKVISITAQT
jgi:hypothetical protein